MVDFFQGDWFQAQCKGKKRIILYGLSMGGFVALIYSSLIPGSVVLALSPRTSLHLSFGNRPHKILRDDWTGPYSDVNDVINSHNQAYIIYSRGNVKDKKQVELIANHHSITTIEVTGSSHNQIGPLIEVCIMSKVLQAISEARFSKNYFDSLAPLLEKSPTEHLYRAEDNPNKEFRDVSFTRARELSAPKSWTKLDQKIIQRRFQWAIKEDDVHTFIGLVKHICTNKALHSSAGLVMFAVRKSLLLKQTNLAQTALDTLLSSPNLNTKMRGKIDDLLDNNSHLYDNSISQHQSLVTKTSNI